MRKISTLLLLLTITVAANSQTCPTGLSGTFSVGPGGNYTTITAALSQLRTNGVNGNVILELQPSYTSTGETFPISFGGIGCLSATKSLTVRPAAGAVNLLISSTTNVTFYFDNTRYVTIDGRPGGLGTSRQLKIMNGQTFGTEGMVTFINDASYNKLTYLEFDGKNDQQGYIYFGTSTSNVTDGNSYNEIADCYFNHTGLAGTHSLLSKGSLNKKNKGNIVRNSLFNNMIGSSITLLENNEAWLIENNSFYGSISFTHPYSRDPVINIDDTSSSGFSVTGNFIGGSGPGCSGSPMQAQHVFYGIKIRSGSGSYSSIQNNTIANINAVASGFFPIFAGITMDNGKFRCGDITGNTIGSITTANNITLMNNQSGDLYTIHGIDAGTSPPEIDSTIIKNNTIGGISCSPNAAAKESDLSGIFLVATSKGFVEIAGNTIGSSTSYNSLLSAGKAGSTVSGISVRSDPLIPTYQLIKNNVISNLTGSATGIYGGGNSDIIGNTISGLYATYFSNYNGPVYGIRTAKGGIVSGNTIRNLTSKSQSVEIRAILIENGKGTLVEKNNIHSLQGLQFSPGSSTYKGIDLNGGNKITVRNNMVRLGIDSLGQGVNGNFNLYGIWCTADSTDHLFNSVYIGGDGISETITMLSTGRVNSIQNNIFYNGRTSSIPSSSKNIALYYSGSYILEQIINHNIYYAPGINGLLYRMYSTGSGIQDANSITAMRLLTKNDSNSVYYNPNFINPNGTILTGNLHLASPNPAEGQGMAIASVADDIDGGLRSNLTPTDIGADAGNFALQDGDAPIITHSNFPGQPYPGTENYIVKITDNGSGVDTSGSNKPRMWFRKKSPAPGAWASVAGNLQSGTVKGGEWLFTPDLSLSATSYNPGDSVEYYFVAQDKGPIINLGYSRTGITHTNVTTQGTVPANLLKFIIFGFFTDTVYVGSGQAYTSLTNTGGFFHAATKNVFPPSATTPVIYITSDLLSETGTYGYTSVSANQPLIKLATNSAVLKKIRNSVNTPDALIWLKDVHDFMIDGSVNGSGRYLQFTSSNTAPVSSGQPALSMLTAKNITIKNCIFESNTTATSTAVIKIGPVIGSSNVTFKLRQLTIENNLVTSVETGANTGMPVRGLLLTGYDADSVYLRKNEFTNIGTTGIQVGETFTQLHVKVIIDSNHFYNNSTFTSQPASYTAILQNTIHSPAFITNNYIGGKLPFAQLPAWQVGGTGMINVTGISLTTDNTAISVIRGNVIRNIKLRTSGNFRGIEFAYPGSFDIYNNMIGDGTDTSIAVAYSSLVQAYGITSGYTNPGDPRTISIHNNSIGGIFGGIVTGIWLHTYNPQVNNNIVRHMAGATNIVGMDFEITNGNIGANTISDLKSTNTINPAYGIKILPMGSPTEGQIMVERNKLFDIRLPASSTAKLYGINLDRGNTIVQHNMITLDNGGLASGAGISGIYLSNNNTTGFSSLVRYNTIYVGGVSNQATTTAALYVEGGKSTGKIQNNLFYNERTGTGSHVAVAVLPTSGNTPWTDVHIPDYNLFVTNDTARINNWNGSIVGLNSWKLLAKGDSASYRTTNLVAPSSRLFTNLTNGDLHLNVNDSICWYANGKAMPLPQVSGDIDLASGARSTSLFNGPTDIGADEFNTSTLPPVLTISGNHVPGGSDSLFFAGRLMAVITWANQGSLPTLGLTRYYSGVWPLDTNNNGAAAMARYLSSWWDIPATGGSNYAYNLTLFYDSSMLGRVTDPSTIVINKRQTGVPGSWVNITPTSVNTLLKSITVSNQTSFSQFTATDVSATLQTGVLLPDLQPAWVSNLVTAGTGTNATLKFAERNTGSASAAAHRISVYLSNDNLLTPGTNGDILLAQQNIIVSLAAGATSDTFTKVVAIPCDYSTGSRYFILQSDDLSQVSEINESNNLVSQAVTINTGVTTPATPVISQTPSGTVCSGTGVSLQASVTNCSTCSFQWSGPGGFTANTASVSVTAAGNYLVTVTNNCGSSTASYNLVNQPNVTPTVSVSYTGCPTNTLVFTATGTNAGSTPVYQWWVNSSIVSYQNPATFTNLVNGDQVYVRLIPGGICSSIPYAQSAPITVSCITTAIPVVEGLEDFRLSPNPTRGKLSVHLKMNTGHNVSFRMTDQTGRVIYTATGKITGGVLNREIDLGAYADGIYFLTTTIGRESFVKKIVLSKNH